MNLRYGLEGGEPLSHEQAAARLGITPEDALVMETNALMKRLLTGDIAVSLVGKGAETLEY